MENAFSLISMSFVQNIIYPIMPVSIQNLMISGFGYQWYRRRFGGAFKSFLEEVKARELFAHEQWSDYQTEMLRKILVHAYRNVPFYREKYTNSGILQSDLQNIKLSELKHLPYLEKDDLRRFGTSLLLSEKRSKGIFISSSGSTGTPTKIYLPIYFHQKWTAVMEARVRNWAGVNKDTPRGMIGGRRIIKGASASAPYYRYNFFERQTYLSAYHISSNSVDNYLEGIIDNRVEYLTGYAMSIYLLSRFIAERGLTAPKLTAVITSSEKLTHEMRRTIEEVFQCRVFDSYSGCEACGLISETPEGIMVVSPDAGIMEFIDFEGNYVNPGETGEIVSTGLINYDQPLIRYRIGDLARVSKDQSPVNGRHMLRIDEIEGRIEDTVTTPDGRVMVRFHSVFVDIPGLKSGQVIQHSYTKFTIKLIIEKGVYNKEISENTLKNRLISQIGIVDVIFDYPDRLIHSSSGKVKAVISELH